jgi:hypothetical protein
MTSSTDTSNPADSPRWEFVQEESAAWHWHRGANGHAPASSEAFKDFGKCVSDAIKHGFRPGAQRYSTLSGGWKTDYAAESALVSAGPGEHPPAPPAGTDLH